MPPLCHTTPSTTQARASVPLISFKRRPLQTHKVHRSDQLTGSSDSASASTTFFLEHLASLEQPNISGPRRRSSKTHQLSRYIFASFQSIQTSCIVCSLQSILAKYSPYFSSSMINDHKGRMATELPTTNGSAQNGNAAENFTVKTGLARMLKGGVIMDVVNAEQVRCPKTSITRRS